MAVTTVVLALHLLLEFPRFLLLPAGAVFGVLMVVSWRRITRLGAEQSGDRR